MLCVTAPKRRVCKQSDDGLLPQSHPHQFESDSGPHIAVSVVGSIWRAEWRIPRWILVTFLPSSSPQRHPLTQITGSLGDSAIKAWVNLNPSTPWANKLAERVKGLPFGQYLHTAPARRRALTGPIDPEQLSLWQMFNIFSLSEPDPQTNPQTDSLFLSKLPLDIRMIIYEMVLGDMTFHLDAANPRGRILLQICQQPDVINDPNHQCHDLSAVRPSSAPREEHREATGLLPLLVTCRRIYTESIKTLYSANTFEFTKHSAAFRFLKMMIPPQRLHDIRHFRLRMQLPHHPTINSRSRRDWNDLFNFFSQEMSGLLSLRLAVQMLQPAQARVLATNDEDGVEWVKPLMAMASDAYRRRGCKVELVTGGIAHDINKTWKDTTASHPTESPETVLELSSITVHEKIRLSLRSHG